MRINGEQVHLDGRVKVSDLLVSRGYDRTRTAIELNGRILPKRDYDDTCVCDGDSMEIVSFVGGG